MIGENVYVFVNGIGSGNVSISIHAPKQVKINRATLAGLKRRRP